MKKIIFYALLIVIIILFWEGMFIIGISVFVLFVIIFLPMIPKTSYEYHNMKHMCVQYKKFMQRQQRIKDYVTTLPGERVNKYKEYTESLDNAKKILEKISDTKLNEKEILKRQELVGELEKLIEEFATEANILEEGLTTSTEILEKNISSNQTILYNAYIAYRKENLFYHYKPSAKLLKEIKNHQ